MIIALWIWALSAGTWTGIIMGKEVAGWFTPACDEDDFIGIALSDLSSSRSSLQWLGRP